MDDVETHKVLLIEGGDHKYIKARIRKVKVSFNTKTKEYFEYCGDEYLEENEVVVYAEVVE